MSGTIQLLLLLSIIILVAKATGLLATRLGQPAILGQLIAGVILGPTVLGLLQLPAFAGSDVEQVVLDLGELGVIFLMFMAGLEVDIDQMFRSGRVALLTGTLGVLAPLGLGTLTALAFNFPLLDSIFIGLILTATSVSISAQTLLELGVLQSREGLALLGAAVADDVLGILLLSVFLALAQGGASASEIAIVILRMGLYFGISIALGLTVLPRLTRWVDRLPVSEGTMALVLVVTLLYAWSAQVVGDIAAITGAFIAGTLFARTPVRRRVADGMHVLTYAFFVPVFLIGVGLRADARVLGSAGLLFAFAIIGVAVIGKVAGSWLGARLSGFENRAALRVGVGMISRGEVGLIIAAIGLQLGWVNQNVYATMILMVLATTLMTPLLLKQMFRQELEQPIEIEPQVQPIPLPDRRRQKAPERNV